MEATESTDSVNTFEPDIPDKCCESTKAEIELGDLWSHRNTGMICGTCMHYTNYRCRRHAPTMQGYPGVYPEDWCGDHKMAKEQMGGI